MALLVLGGAAAAAWASVDFRPAWIDAREAVLAHAEAIYDETYAPTVGPRDADVTISEFFDYNCRHCRRVAPVLDQVVSDDGRLRVIYRDLPFLSEGSLIAAKAALAARHQGKYVELHRAFMELAEDADEAAVMRIAGELGLDVERLRFAMEDPEIATALDRNFKLATALKINGTPAILIGEKLVLGEMEAKTIKALVAEARSASK